MNKLLELIDKKISEISDYPISTQENERQYIAWIGCLNEAKFLLRENETTEDKLFISKLTET